MNDNLYMRRCLQLALSGRQNVKSNPMVGAVIVAEDGRIIGEGYHVRYGEGHAEVNAFASVKAEDEKLLPHSTVYVSLEPCSHYGKTPPCADLIISKNVRRVVVGCVDPFAKVSGNGIKKLQDAGIEVTVGVMEKECLDLNKRFVVYNTLKRPYVILKWCQTINGYIDDNFKPTLLSTPFTQMLTHKLRAESGAILVGRITAERDKPKLNVRLWHGDNPFVIVIDRNSPFDVSIDYDKPVIPQLMDFLYEKNIQSLLVEGGTKTHEHFIASGIWDEIRVEIANKTVSGGTKAPQLPDDIEIIGEKQYDNNRIITFRHKN